MRIVRLANFVTPRSGGLRTALRELGAGYAAAGHEPVLVIPGPHAADEATPQGRVVTLPGPLVPGVGGYRVLVDRARLARTLAALRPDRLEVSDRSTLRWTGDWARRAGVPSMMVSHESLAGLLRAVPGGALAADRLNARSAAAYDRIVCTTAWAAAEFARVGAPVTRAPLGVDLAFFRPGRHDPALRDRLAGPHEVLVVHCGRLSTEKRVDRSVRAVAAARRAGLRATLVVAGDGPLRERLTVQAARDAVPVRWLGHVAGRDRLAALLATADVVLAPGPVETFGLAALEALASGTPVVVSGQSALPEVVGAAGAVVPGDDAAVWGAALAEVADRPVADRRAAARARAERFGWPAAVAAFLAAHRAGVSEGDRVPQ
ncbi:glycosyltransferase [Spirilliplanes yamanashiensis]|uniref:GDP-mannose-dependent alpha-(1-6)-phosphatidylinositol dimannoside mannosyltransferase n=1 Tax=Spirilliplanes yamanashiensis TaxID=42233 RepID=A0A8J3Y9U6_9ACTN|nr:glycosyltransferase [Spirilliplanes yamanashiensis]MDP9815678.1 alpha-1,6-mannosyltransferase [Spirilliplanes yamanashiensis]GIJ03932.1 GDP-mannose-dependent alpha-(1-6)-phosphatidylinositol dimannoside mannosyltransferase [Spirilliplanes yamanashiensis]